MSKFVRVANLNELHEAYQLAEEAGIPMRYLAGGTDILVECHVSEQSVQLQKKRASEDVLFVDISGWQELREIHEENSGLSIGALVTHDRLSKELPEWADVVAEAASLVGGPQIRARGTVGGNCANHVPAADTPPALILMDAEVGLIDPAGRSEASSIDSAWTSEVVVVSLLDYLKAKDEYQDFLIAWVRIRKAEGFRYGFYKSGRRRAMAVSLVSLAVRGRFEELPAGIASGECKPNGVALGELKIVTGAVTQYPFVFCFAPDKPGKVLRSREDCLETAEEIAEAVVKEMNDVFGPRASRGYKKRVVVDRIYAFLSEGLTD